MSFDDLPALYRRAQRLSGGSCPIEAGFLGALADNECRHGNLPGDKIIDCGCWTIPVAEPAAIASGAALRARRRQLGLTTRQLGAAAGLTHSTIAVIERTNRKPRPATRAAIERALERAA